MLPCFLAVIALLLPPGVVAPCCCQWHSHCQHCCLGHWNGGCFHHVWGCTLPPQGKAGRPGSAVPLLPLGLSGSPALPLQAGRPEPQVLPPQPKGQGHRPCCCCCPLPVAVGPAVTRRPELLTQPPLLLLGSLGLQAQLLWLGSQDHRSHLHCPLSFASSMWSSPPSLETLVCGILQHPGVLGKGDFGELWTFY